MATGIAAPKPPASTMSRTAVPLPANTKSRKKARAAKTAAPKKFCASIYPRTPLPDSFVNAVRDVEAILKGPVWMIIQDLPGPSGQAPKPLHTLDDALLEAFLRAKATLPVNKPINLILESPGGQAKAAYRISNLFRLHCGGFNVFVPEWAKSAATLLALGASNIYLAKYAELGPLDVQVFDAEREGMSSALDEVQALERLNAFALQAVDAGMLMLTSRSGKSLGTLLPHVLHFVAEMLRPLFDKLDTIHYTQMSRLLKVGEAYAVRQLEHNYEEEAAEVIARQLVNEYPEHGFYIDRKEAARMGLKTRALSDELEIAVEKLKTALHRLVVIGQLKEVK
jgi:hypothetical protein